MPATRVATEPPETFQVDVLSIDEIDADERIVAVVGFDLDDFDSAITELDARYLAGEAAPHARTWSVIVRGTAATNRREKLPLTPDCLTVDHRLHATFGADDQDAYVHATWELTPDFYVLIESVHRLSDLGAVITQASRGTSQNGFEAEWRQITLLTIEGDLGNRCEIFDETDLATALARFDELSQPARRLENAASQVSERFLAQFAAGDWDAVADSMSDDYVSDDRRQVVGSGIRHGRDAQIADMRAIADVWNRNLASIVLATRGRRLVLRRVGVSDPEQGPEAFLVETLSVIEIDEDERIVRVVSFDPDDFDSAVMELDARYLAGEAAPHAHSWTVITREFAALNRRELPATTPDWVNIDHRRGASFAPGEMFELLGAAWNRAADLTNFIEAVHRLNDFGGVITHLASETSQEGFNAEWRVHSVFTLQGDMINRCEVFDEADLNAAIARFDELNRPAPRLESAVAERFLAHFAARDWGAMAQDFADDYYCDDRRRVVNAGLREGRDAAIEDLRMSDEVGLLANITADIIATRGERCILTRFCASGHDDGAIQHDVLQVLEHNAAGQVAAAVLFDIDDFDSAIAELDARYLAGEAAANARTWSLVADACAAMNRHEHPATTPDWVSVDHRRGLAFGLRDMAEYIRGVLDITPDFSHYIEAVHRLGNRGAVATYKAHGTSQDGFNAEWRMINVLLVEGNAISRLELFDDVDIDSALARFDELQPQARRLENAASQAYERICECLETRDWDAVADLCAENVSVEDRRRVVNAGIRTGRDAAVKDLQVTAEMGFTYKMLSVIATRGDRLALMRVRGAGRDPGAFTNEVPNVVELDSDGRITAAVVFDLEDIDAAFEELDARYLVGEASPYATAWLVISGGIAAVNRRELPATTPDWVTIDHRRLPTFETSDLPAAMSAVWDLTPDASFRIEAVHRLSSFGAVVTHAVEATSQEGVDVEWRMIQVMTVEGDLLSRFELFDEPDLDAALARFDELQPHPRRLGNAASRVAERFWAHFGIGDWDVVAETVADDFRQDDRRRVVGAGVRHGRDAEIVDLHAIAAVWAGPATPTYVAVRGQRLALMRVHFSFRDQGPEGFVSEVLGICEINADERIVAAIVFDPDDVDAAFAELDARYLAGEAARYSQTWSVIAQTCAAFNRHVLPAADWITVDHRRLAVIDATEGPAAMRGIWDVTPDLTIRIEAVHRLSNFKALSTFTACGTSLQGLDVEWQMILLLAVEGDRINRCEIFDDTELDAAVVRFEELQPHPPRLENAASQAVEREWACFATPRLGRDGRDNDRRLLHI